jgi:hypothetical protein
MALIYGISGSVAILFELGEVHYSRLPIFILIGFWEMRKFLTNGLRESARIVKYCFYVVVSSSVSVRLVDDDVRNKHLRLPSVRFCRSIST